MIRHLRPQPSLPPNEPDRRSRHDLQLTSESDAHLLIDRANGDSIVAADLLIQCSAARDFSDICELVQHRIITIDDGWQLWTLKNPGVPVDEAMRNATLSFSRNAGVTRIAFSL